MNEQLVQAVLRLQEARIIESDLLPNIGDVWSFIPAPAEAKSKTTPKIPRMPAVCPIVHART